MNHTFVRIREQFSHPDSRSRMLQLICLTGFCVIAVAYFFMRDGCDRLFNYYLENYTILFSLPVFAIALTRPRFWSEKGLIAICLLSLLWIPVSETFLRLDGQSNSSFQVYFSMYLLALPFAVGAEDGEKRRGLSIVTFFYLIYLLHNSLRVLVCFLDLLPGYPLTSLPWDGPRLSGYGHPNLTASFYFMGIGLAIYYFFRSKKRPVRAAWVTFGILQFFCLALTNSRTSILMASGMVAAALFFSQWDKGWKPLLFAGAAGVVLILLLFNLSKGLFTWNEGRLIQAYLEPAPVTQTQEEAVSSTAPLQEADPAQDATEPAEADPAQEAPEPEETAPLDSHLQIDPNTGAVSLTAATKSGQGSFMDNLSSFNGRIGIWKLVLETVAKRPTMAIFGCDNVVSHLGVYANFEDHAHNSWLQILVRRGIPGLVMAVVFTLVTLRNALVLLFRRHEDMSIRAVALFSLAMFGVGFLEPFLFTCEVGYFQVNFLLFICAGYLQAWYKALPAAKKTASPQE